MSIQSSSMPLTENDKKLQSGSKKNYIQICYPWDLNQMLAFFNEDEETIIEVAQMPEAQDLVFRKNKKKYLFKKQFKNFCEEQGLRLNKCWEK